MTNNTEERPAGLGDYFAALVRRRKPAMLTAVSCVMAAVLLALLLPAHYRSTGTILIEQQEVPVELVRSTVSAYADQRLQVISQRVMTSQNLLDIIRRYELYPQRQGRDTREELVERMRDDIVFKMISAEVIDPRSGSPRQATIAFSVSYTSRVPAQAVKVANELTTLYLNENLTERARLANNATHFLNDESERLNKDIAAVEGRLAQFKLKNADALPELQEMNRSLLDRTEQDLRATEMRSASLDQQRMFIEAQLAQVQPNSMLTTEGGERILSPHDRLRTLKARLASARALYAPAHPDIVRMEREIRGLEVEVAGAAEAAVETNKPLPKGDDGPDNPAYIQLQTQLSATLNERNALTARMAQLRAQILNYQRQVARAPQTEREYRELLRDHESAYGKYREVRAKQMEAQLAQNLETDRKGERFTLIEPPLSPEKPVSPNRAAILALGVVLALGVTLVVVVLLEMLDTSVRGRRDLVNLLAAPPLAVLPWIETAQDRILRTRRRRYAIAGAAASVLVSIGLIHLFYRPLDMVWLALLRRVGG